MLHVGRPQGEVVPQQLHDERGVLVALLAQGVKLCDGVVEGRFGQAAGAVGGVEDLVVEDGEVERQPQPDGVGGGQLRHGDVARRLVRHQAVLRRLLAVVARGKLGQVAVVVALPSQGQKTKIIKICWKLSTDILY